jgi:hypothetical protein
MLRICWVADVLNNDLKNRKFVDVSNSYENSHSLSLLGIKHKSHTPDTRCIPVSETRHVMNLSPELQKSG